MPESEALYWLLGGFGIGLELILALIVWRVSTREDLEMTREELRAGLLTDLDGVLANRLIAGFLSGEQRRVLQAVRELVQRDNGTVLDRVLTLLRSGPLAVVDQVPMPPWKIRLAALVLGAERLGHWLAHQGNELAPAALIERLEEAEPLLGPEITHAAVALLASLPVAGEEEVCEP